MIQNFDSDRSDPPPAIVFNHIAKCAGTSIGGLLSYGFTAEDLYSTAQNTADSVRYLAYEALEKKRLIWGHFGDWARQRTPNRLCIVTMREPWSRFRSTLRHAARSPHGLGSMQLKAYALDPTDRNFAAEGVIESVSKSRQLHYLLNPGTHRKVADRKHQERLIDEATANLREYDIIVTTETIDDAARHLADLIGAPPIEHAPKLNTSSRWSGSEKVEPSPKHEDRFRQLLESDEVLFGRASEMAIAQRGAYRRTSEEYADRYSAVLARIPRTHTWMLDWSGIVKASGWGLRQRPAIDGYQDRWARILEAPSAFIDCPLRPSPANVAEVIMWVDDPAAYKRLEIKVGEAEPDWEQLIPIRTNKKLQVWRARITEGLTEPATRLQFDLKGAKDRSKFPTLWFLDAHIRPA
jgi:hypothetical protein